MHWVESSTEDSQHLSVSRHGLPNPASVWLVIVPAAAETILFAKVDETKQGRCSIIFG